MDFPYTFKPRRMQTRNMNILSIKVALNFVGFMIKIVSEASITQHWFGIFAVDRTKCVGVPIYFYTVAQAEAKPRHFGDEVGPELHNLAIIMIVNGTMIMLRFCAFR